MKKIMNTIVLLALIVQTSLASAQETQGEALQKAAAQTQTLIQKMRQAVDPGSSNEERQKIVNDAATIISKLNPRERLLITEQLLFALSRSESTERSAVLEANLISGMIALGGVVILVVSKGPRSGPEKAAGATAVLLGMFAIFNLRPSEVEAHVASLRSQLEALRDAQTLEIKATELN